MSWFTPSQTSVDIANHGAYTIMSDWNSISVTLTLASLHTTILSRRLWMVATAEDTKEALQIIDGTARIRMHSDNQMTWLNEIGKMEPSIIALDNPKNFSDDDLLQARIHISTLRNAEGDPKENLEWAKNECKAYDFFVEQEEKEIKRELDRLPAGLAADLHTILNARRDLQRLAPHFSHIKPQRIDIDWTPRPYQP